MKSRVVYDICELVDFVVQVDRSGKKKKGGFSVGKKKLKTKLTPTAKAKAAQAMELDN